MRSRRRGTPRGAEWNRKLNDEIKRLDPTRYTTSGINGLMAASDRMGEILCQASGMSPEELETMMAQEAAGEAGNAGVAGENGLGQAGDQEALMRSTGWHRSWKVRLLMRSP